MCDPVTGFQFLTRIALAMGAIVALDLATGSADERWLRGSANNNEIGGEFEGATYKFMSAFRHVQQCLEKQLGANDPLVKKFTEGDFQRDHKSWAKDPISKTTLQRVAEVLDMYKRFFDPIKDDISKALETLVECLTHWHELQSELANMNSHLEHRVRQKMEDWKEEKARLIYMASRPPVGRN